jgi:hypothetical protein
VSLIVVLYLASRQMLWEVLDPADANDMGVIVKVPYI